MASGEDEFCAIAARGEPRVEAGRFAEGGGRRLEGTFDEVEEAPTQVRDARGRNHHRKELKHLERGHGEAEPEHVLVPPYPARSLEASDVLRVIEIALAIR